MTESLNNFLNYFTIEMAKYQKARGFSFFELWMAKKN